MVNVKVPPCPSVQPNSHHCVQQVHSSFRLTLSTAQCCQHSAGSQRWLQVQEDTGHVLDNTLRKGKDREGASPGRELRLKYKWLLLHTRTSDDYSLDLLLKNWKEEWEEAVFSREFLFVSFKLQVHHFAMLSDHLFQYSQSSSSLRFCASCEAKDFKQYS